MESLMFLSLAVSFPLFLRWTTSIYPYSGAGKPPMFGDYEAQRHWMEISTNLPVQQWYVNSTENDLLYWGLDYPPLTAYHSWIMGKIAHWINPNWVELGASRGFESPTHKLFMRYSVIATDVMIYFSGIIAFCMYSTKLKTLQSKLLTAGVMLCYPGLILIDHGHFQYNSISLGLLVWAVTLLSLDRQLLAAIAFVLALNYKQMELYHALPFFCYMLANCFNGKSNWILRLSMLGVTVILTFSAVWFPFLHDQESALQVVRRVFPFSRGLFEDKVASFWCTVSVFFKIREKFSPEQIVRMCLTTTMATLFPSSIGLFLEPSMRNFKLALVNSSLVFFLFSYHVHEKSILLAAIPVCLMLPEKPLSSLWFLTISSFSMLPLLLKDGLLLPHVCLSGVFFLVVVLAWQYLFTPASAPDLMPPPSNPAELRRERERRERDGVFEAITGVFFWLSLAGAFLLTILSVAVPPPSHLPDLWPVLVSGYSCGHFLVFLVYYHWLQLTEDNHRPVVNPGKSRHQAAEHQKGKSRTFNNKRKKTQ